MDCGAGQLDSKPKFMWSCILVSSSTVQIESLRSFVSRKLSFTCAKVLVPFGNILLRSLVAVAYLKLLLIPASFIGEKVIAICYINDLIIWARHKKDILHTKGVDFEQEDDAAGFLGVHIECNPNTEFLDMMQKVHPCQRKGSCQTAHGQPVSGNFNYSSVVGMLLHLVGHKCPDIKYAVTCAARYIFGPKLVHKQILKQIGHNLKDTTDKGLIMKPSEKLLKIVAFQI
ncbi:hypothetical protein ACHAXS_000632 [Conticribra weissflogii]